MRAMVQLPGYLERVLAGGRDLALVLLPLLNDLRAVRGSALLSEGTLLLLNLKSDRQAQPAAPAPGEPPLSVGQWARRLRARFQTGLIGWIRGERAEQNLEIIAAVATRLEQVAAHAAGVPAVVGGRRTDRVAARERHREQHLGQAPAGAGRPRDASACTTRARRAMRSTRRWSCSITCCTTSHARASGGPRVAAVRASFRLNELLPVDESIEQERENLSAPSIKLMHTVAAAIREDLSKVKDVMDIYVRRGGGQAEELVPQVALLKKIGDTLGVLGLGELRSRVQEATAKLEGIIAGTEASGESALVQVAAGLIKVEDHLDDDLVGLILPRDKNAPADGESLDQDFQQVQGAVLRECVVNLARIKEYVAQNVSGTLDAAGFDNWPELMRGINAGLLMLGKTRAVEIIEEITLHLKRVMQPGGTSLAPDYLDRLADAIVSLEYYIETLQAGRSDPWYMLDNARACLDALKRAPERVLPTVSAATSGSYAKTLLIDRPSPSGDTTDIRRLELAATAPPLLAAAAPAHDETIPDPDLIRLFVEEAKEELAKIEHQFPIWDHNPLESDALLIVRRSFHTLKGSGRMVNARAISDFAWAIENLLNRILDGTLQRSPPVLQTLRAAIAALPQLVAELESGTTEHTDLTPLAARAHALASGREELATAAATATAATLAGRGVARSADAIAPGGSQLSEPPKPAIAAAVPAPPTKPQPVSSAAAAAELAVVEPTSSEPDTALREIYARETASHVGTVRGWMARERRAGAPHVLPEEVYRACHTLVGSSTMAEARHGIRLAEPMNHWLRKSFDSGIGLDDSDLIAARRLHGRDGSGGRPSRRRYWLLRAARHAARPHRARRTRPGPPHRRGQRDGGPQQHQPGAAAAGVRTRTLDAGAGSARERPGRRAASARGGAGQSTRGARDGHARRRGGACGLRPGDRFDLQRRGGRAAGSRGIRAGRPGTHRPGTASWSRRCAGRCIRSRAARAWPASPPWANSRTSSRAWSGASRSVLPAPMRARAPWRRKRSMSWRACARPLRRAGRRPTRPR